MNLIMFIHKGARYQMKKTFAIPLAFLLIFICFIPSNATEITEATTEHPETTEYPDDPSREPDIVSNAAIVIDSLTGQILYEKNAYDKNYPASITKIMTTIVALDNNVNFNDTITMSDNAIWGIERDSTNIGLDVGEKITVEDCIYATMVKSANECAYAIAEHVAGDLDSFSKLMNSKAKEIGCEHTHFITPNGLHDDNHYTCAYDMALITKYALQNDTFRKIAGTLTYTVPPTNLTEESTELWNGNKMISSVSPYYYEYCEGGKTGYTTKANNTLVTFSKKDELELICVILDCDGSKYAYTDSKALYNYCYNNYSYFYPLSDFSFDSDDEDMTTTNTILKNYYSGLSHEMIDLTVDKDFSLLINKSIDTTKIEREIKLYNEAKENTLGEIIFSYNGEQIGTAFITSTTPLLSSQMIQKEEKKTTSSIWKKIKKVLLIVLIIIAVLIAIFGIYIIFAASVRAIKRKQRTRYRRRRKKRDDDYYF